METIRKSSISSITTPRYEPESGDKEFDGSTVSSTVTTGRTPRSSIVDNSSVRRFSRPSRQSFSSSKSKFNVWSKNVASMVSVRRRLGRRYSRTTGDLIEDDEMNPQSGNRRRKSTIRVDDDFVSKLDIRDLPREPRFSALLSPEGQYSLLRSYEDVLLRTLQTAYPESVHKLQKTRTPFSSDFKTEILDFSSNRDAARMLARLGIPGYRPDNTAVGRTPGVGEVDLDGSTHIPDSASEAACLTSSSGTLLNDDRGLQLSTTSQYGSSTARGHPTTRLPSIERQLISSYRVQNAIDILDCVHAERGNVVLTQHHRRHKIQPVEHFQLWRQAWINDFVLAPRPVPPIRPKPVVDVAPKSSRIVIT